jgi:hypothetical protein
MSGRQGFAGRRHGCVQERGRGRLVVKGHAAARARASAGEARIHRVFVVPCLRANHSQGGTLLHVAGRRLQVCGGRGAQSRRQGRRERTEERAGMHAAEKEWLLLLLLCGAERATCFKGARSRRQSVAARRARRGAQLGEVRLVGSRRCTTNIRAPCIAEKETYGSGKSRLRLKSAHLSLGLGVGPSTMYAGGACHLQPRAQAPM